MYVDAGGICSSLVVEIDLDTSMEEICSSCREIRDLSRDLLRERIAIDIVAVFFKSANQNQTMSSQ